MAENEENAANSVPVDANNMNKQKIVCERCASVILLAGKAKYTKKQIFLPHMKKKSEATKPEDGETLDDMWIVDDMMTFENVGFCNTVDSIKYLICADCEIGPVGWHDTRNKKEFYIAHDRIKYS